MGLHGWSWLEVALDDVEGDDCGETVFTLINVVISQVEYLLLAPETLAARNMKAFADSRISLATSQSHQYLLLPHLQHQHGYLNARLRYRMKAD